MWGRNSTVINVLSHCCQTVRYEDMKNNLSFILFLIFGCFTWCQSNCCLLLFLLWVALLLQMWPLAAPSYQLPRSLQQEAAQLTTTSPQINIGKSTRIDIHAGGFSRSVQTISISAISLELIIKTVSQQLNNENNNTAATISRRHQLRRRHKFVDEKILKVPTSTGPLMHPENRDIQSFGKNLL